jgi:hypothetical protein
MNQSKLGSLIESLTNVVIGFAINWTANMLILPLFGFHVTGGQAFGIGVFFTVISVASQLHPAPLVQRATCNRLRNAWREGDEMTDLVFAFVLLCLVFVITGFVAVAVGAFE